MHSDEALALLAEDWAQSNGLASSRICPLCRHDAATPNHVLMVGEAQAVVRDIMEANLCQGVSAASLSLVGGQWCAEAADQAYGPDAVEAVAERR